MHDSKLLNLLRNLSESELKEFEKFVDSPFFSKGRDLMPFFKAIKPFYPEFNDENLAVESIFQRIFPDKKFEGKKSYNIIKTLSSQLFQLCKDFLLQLELKDDVVIRKYYLLNQLRKKKMYREFDKENTTSLSDGNYPEKGNTKDIIKKFLIASVIMDCHLDKDQFNEALDTIFTMSEHAVTAALISCFKFEDEKNIARIYNLEMRSTLMNSLLENTDIEKLVDEIEKDKGRFAEIIRIYYMIYRMNKYKDKTEYFFETKKLLEESSHLFGQFENHELWNTMLTYCSSKNFTKDDKLFRKEIRYIHIKMVNLGIYKRTPEEDFHIVLFRNILQTATSEKDYEWLEKFIAQYSPELHIDHRDDMRNYSYAYLNFVKGEFENSLTNLLKVKFDLFLYKHDVKRLQLQTYYELRYFEEAISLIDTFQHYLKNTASIPDVHKTGYKNFLTYMKELIRLNTADKINPDEIDFLENKIANDTKTGSVWIREKLKELKTSH